MLQNQIPKCYPVKLLSVSGLTDKYNPILYSRNTSSLAKDKYGHPKKIFRKLYLDEDKYLSESRQRELHRQSRADVIRRGNENMNLFYKATERSTRDLEIQNFQLPNIQNKCTSTEAHRSLIKVFRPNNLFSKFCSYKPYKKLLYSAIPFMESQKTLRFHSNVREVKPLEVFKNPFSEPLFTFKSLRKNGSDYLNCSKTPVSNYKTKESREFLEKIKGPKKSFKKNPTPSTWKSVEAYRETQQKVNALQNEIEQENVPVVTKSNYLGTFQPRLSKENIQGLIKQSLENMKNKRSQDENSKGTLKFKREKTGGSRRSTISEYFSESGDFENTSSDPTQNPTFRFSLDATELISNAFQKEDVSQNSQNSLDLGINESAATVIALRQTKSYIECTQLKEHRTFSGFNLGYDSVKEFSNQKFNFEGNYGYIDGVNMTTVAQKDIASLAYKEIATETFLALSHMYSLTKLLHRKSIVAVPKIITRESSSFISNHRSVERDDDKEVDDQEFHSDSSINSNRSDKYQSFDISLLERFKSNLNK